jgi:hypothetical protein
MCQYALPGGVIVGHKRHRWTTHKKAVTNNINREKNEIIMNNRIKEELANRICNGYMIFLA